MSSLQKNSMVSNSFCCIISPGLLFEIISLASGLDTESAELDFTAIFQCIHIHDVLGKRVQLKLEFDESRRVSL